jgi:peptidoglycan/LPS O-acetylase OafA/YrhL
MADGFTAPIERPRHIPSLDGLRALSVLLVIAVHSTQRFGMTHRVPFWVQVLANGGLGVFLFFVISGYLITTLLLRERDKTGAISLKSFYLRRGFRILPPLYVYILFIALLGMSGHLPGFNGTELATALTFTRNYSPHVSLWAFEHLWSLCIEEQFYLLWPAVLVVCAWRRKGADARRAAAWVTLAVIVVEPFVRVLSYRYLPNFHNPGAFHMQADGLMFGAVGALLEGTQRFERVYRRAMHWPWLAPVLLFVVSGTLGIVFGNYWNLPVGITVNGFLALMWLLWLVRNPASPAGRVMNLPAVAWIGRLSYSLYLWQTFFLHHDSVEVLGHDAWWNTFPGAWLCILGAAMGSFYGIEQPALRVRDVCLKKMRWHEP